MNAKIRHCAIWSDGCERSARFYETIFGMRFFTSLGSPSVIPQTGRGVSSAMES